MPEILVTSEWLNDNFNDPDLIILDSSEETNVTGQTIDHEGLQIAGARYFDLENTFSDTKSTLPHTFPSPKQFEKESRKIGISKASKIVVYDNIGVYTSPRVWWMYRIMGHENVYVLDGGLSEWVKNSYKTEKQQRREYIEGDFVAISNEGEIDSLKDMQINLKSNDKCVIDARSAGRFDGSAPEPRDWVKSGHIPGSKNLPFQDVLNDGKFKSKEEIKTLFNKLDVGDKALSFVCGSGLTSCIILLASELVQANATSVYDGSWTEWGANENLPKN